MASDPSGRWMHRCAHDEPLGAPGALPFVVGGAGAPGALPSPVLGAGGSGAPEALPAVGSTSMVESVVVAAAAPWSPVVVDAVVVSEFGGAALATSVSMGVGSPGVAVSPGFGVVAPSPSDSGDGGREPGGGWVSSVALGGRAVRSHSTAHGAYDSRMSSSGMSWAAK